MLLQDFYKQKKAMDSSRVHFAPNISAKKISNALHTFHQHGKSSDTVVLIDDTLMGSGKDGCLVLSDSIVFRESFSDPIEFRFSEIKKISVQGKSVYIDGEKAFKFTMPEEHDLKFTFDTLSVWLKEYLNENVFSKEKVEINFLKNTKIVTSSFFLNKFSEDEKLLHEAGQFILEETNERPLSKDLIDTQAILPSIYLCVKVLEVSIALTKLIPQELEPNINADEMNALMSDEAILLSIGYSIASLANMLYSQLNLNEDQVANLLSPLFLKIVLPFLKTKTDGKRTLRSVTNPVGSVTETELFKKFQECCRNFTFDIRSGSKVKLMRNYSVGLSNAINPRLPIPDSILENILTFIHSDGDVIFGNVDSNLEEILINYLELEQKTQ